MLEGSKYGKVLRTCKLPLIIDYNIATKNQIKRHNYDFVTNKYSVLGRRVTRR